MLIPFAAATLFHRKIAYHVAIYIGGWVEVKNSLQDWEAVIKLDAILGVNSDMFGCLLGVVNYIGLST